MHLGLDGRTILVTSGPTHAPIDAVRFLSNRSTGRLGVQIALEALSRGARVIFVQGPDSARPDPGDEAQAARLSVCRIETVDDLIAALESNLTAGRVDAVVHAMAVLDYAPAEPAAEKVRSGRAEWTIRLVPTPKVIGRVRALSPESVLVGFKLESGADEAGLVAAATALAAASGAALVVANDLTHIGDGRHPALLVSPEGEIVGRPGTKTEIAAALCDWLEGRLGQTRE
jgi:phosphopantothenoylcysteine synthetase/decarboxylase